MKRILWGILAIIILTALIQENIVKSSSSSDVSHQSHGTTGIVPVPISQIEGTPQGPVAASNGYTYAAYYPSTLVTFEISGSTFVPVNYLRLNPGKIQEMVAVDNMLYVLSSGGLRLVDVSNPTSPQVRGFYPIENSSSLIVRNQFAYITTPDWLYIINATNPNQPFLAGFYLHQGMRLQEVTGDHAYFVGEGEMGTAVLHVVSVANMSTPELIGTYTYQDKQTNIFLALQVIGEQGHLLVESYVCGIGGCSGVYEWLVLDLTNPQTPQLMTTGMVWFLGAIPFSRDVSLTIMADQALIIFPRVVKIVDISDPTTPVETAHFEPSDEIIRQTVVDDTIITSSLNGLHLLDISEPGEIKEVAFHPTFWGKRVILAGNYAYVNTPVLVEIDITNPESPFITGPTTDGTRVHSFTIVEDLAYAVNYRNGDDGLERYLQVFQLQYGGPPLLQSELFLDATHASFVSDIIVEGHFAYVIAKIGSLEENLIVVDIEDITELEIVATVDIPSPQDMVIEGNYAYLISSNTWFQVLDISDPYQPESIAVENLLESMTRKIVVNNGYAYVIEANTESFPFKWYLTVIDISSPDTPQLVDRYEAPSSGNVTIAGQYLYLASYWDEPGMFIYNIANPEHPILFSSHPAQGGSIAVDVERELIAMTAGEIGLILFRQVTVESQIWLPFININASN